MSAAISCTRAAAPRLAIRTLRCQRFASTQAADAATENRDMAIETAPVAKVTTPAKAAQRHRIPTLAERMHKALYPELYVNGRPIEGVQVSKPVKAKKVEKKTIRST
jgi:large subunit ribosomal protein L19